MGFGRAVRSGFSHYFDFSGRASQSASWWWFVFMIVVYFAAVILGAAVGGEEGGNIAYGLAFLVLIVP